MLHNKINNVAEPNSFPIPSTKWNNSYDQHILKLLKNKNLNLKIGIIIYRVQNKWKKQNISALINRNRERKRSQQMRAT